MWFSSSVIVPLTLSLLLFVCSRIPGQVLIDYTDANLKVLTRSLLQLFLCSHWLSQRVSWYHCDCFGKKYTYFLCTQETLMHRFLGSFRLSSTTSSWKFSFVHERVNNKQCFGDNFGVPVCTIYILFFLQVWALVINNSNWIRLWRTGGAFKS